MSNNSRTEYRTDLMLGQSPYLFIVYNVQISSLHSVDGFFYFDGVTVKTGNFVLLIIDPNHKTPLEMSLPSSLMDFHTTNLINNDVN